MPDSGAAIIEDCVAALSTEPDRWAGDPGPAFLAAAVLELGSARQKARAVTALEHWLRGLAQVEGAALFGGLGGYVAALAVAVDAYEPLRPLASRLGDRLAAFGDRRPWRTDNLTFADYDLAIGPSGSLVALHMAGAAPELLEPFVEHVAALCLSPGLASFKVTGYAADSVLGWCHGRINTSLAHGVAGVAGALALVRETSGRTGLIDRALDSVVTFLLSQHFRDSTGLPTWPRADRSRDERPSATTPDMRQSWCYGSPGIAWSLWEAARVTGDSRAQAVALRAFTEFCTRFDERTYLLGPSLGDDMGVCHGAAGLCGIADAFYRHAGLPEARELRDRLLPQLAAGVSDLLGPAATEPGATLLNGAAGPLLVRLTAEGLISRSWMVCIGLR
ncbi:MULTISPECIES: lanthionine synthetase LanC family protein [unclassified Streptomyces]|uniref:lanthionine synthetase LanC family protein n=1 Tax=unclassified Streptomyces TaxID=2593676 RepID=UPI0035D749AF